MALYNKKLIDARFNIRNYNPSIIESLLNKRIKEMINPVFSVDDSSQLLIVSLDNYVCKCLNSGTINAYVEQYCEIINKQLEYEPLLIYNLPIRKLDINKIKKYFPKMNQAISKCNSYEKKVIEINDRFNKGITISNKEMQFLVKYLYYTASYENSSEYTKKYDKLIRKILNNNESLKLIEICLIYKIFGYDYCKKLGLSNVEIYFTNTKSNNGISLGQYFEDIIFINKNLYKNSNFISGSLDDSALGNYSALVGLKTVFHEIIHSYQYSELENKSYTNEALYTGAEKIIYKNDNADYNRNYYMQFTENQAQYIGWENIVDFASKYYGKDSEIVKTANENKKYYYLRHSFDKKCDSSSRSFYSGDYINMNLDEYFKKNPTELNNRYSHFLMFYKADGKPRSLMSVLSNFPIKEKYSEFYYNYYIGRIINGETLKSSDLSKLDIVKLGILKSNFIELLNISYRKLKVFNNNYAGKLQRKIGRVNFIRNARVIYDVSQRSYEGLKYLNKKYPKLFTEKEIRSINDTISKIYNNPSVNTLEIKSSNGEVRPYHARR